MPSQKLTAGGSFETLNKAELDLSLREFMVDALKGIRPVQIASQGVADATGVVTLGGAVSVTGGTLGPEVGFFWSVLRLAVRVDGVPAAFSLYRNTVDPGSLIRDVPGSSNGYAPFGVSELLITGGDTLVVQSQSLTPSTGVMSVSGQAAEIPAGLLWKWLTG